MKLGDYGMLTEANANSEKRATISHKALEAFSKARELKSDVWSLGVTLMELAEGKIPFNEANLEEMKYGLYCCNPPSLSSEKWSVECVSFVEKCLMVDVKERWSVKQLMEVSGCGIG